MTIKRLPGHRGVTPLDRLTAGAAAIAIAVATISIPANVWPLGLISKEEAIKIGGAQSPGAQAPEASLVLCLRDHPIPVGTGRVMSAQRIRLVLGRQPTGRIAMTFSTISLIA